MKPSPETTLNGRMSLHTKLTQLPVINSFAAKGKAEPLKKFEIDDWPEVGTEQPLTCLLKWDVPPLALS